ncbi:hypothetical protein DFH06DRAFT_1153245 [Mycena polygramma]|nr:hypothetical protein DFH06DRAFT_1153245 [Mycena polygramma]
MARNMGGKAVPQMQKAAHAREREFPWRNTVSPGVRDPCLHELFLMQEEKVLAWPPDTESHRWAMRRNSESDQLNRKRQLEKDDWNERQSRRNGLLCPSFDWICANGDWIVAIRQTIEGKHKLRRSRSLRGRLDSRGFMVVEAGNRDYKAFGWRERETKRHAILEPMPSEGIEPPPPPVQNVKTACLGDGLSTTASRSWDTPRLGNCLVSRVPGHALGLVGSGSSRHAASRHHGMLNFLLEREGILCSFSYPV